MRHFILVLAIARHRSLSRVAREMGLTQPSVTTALRQIEDIFCTPLFERRAGGLVPTPAGEAVIGYAKRSCAELQATTNTLTSIARGRAGRLRIGVAHGTSQILLTSALTHLIAGEQKIAVVTREGTTDELVRALLDRELDCALARSYDGDSTGISQHPLYRQEACLLTSGQTAKRLLRGAITLPQLAALDWIMPPINTPMRRAYHAMFIAAGISPPLPILETISRRSITAVLKVCPNAIAIVSNEVAKELIDGAQCVVLPFRVDVRLPQTVVLTTSEMDSLPILDSLLTVLKRVGQHVDSYDKRKQRHRT